MTGPVLAVDEDTSGTKALVVCPERGVIGSASAPVRPRHGSGGAVEVDPAELLESVPLAGNRAMAQAGEPVSAVGLANQGETVLAWDPGTGRPPHRRHRPAGPPLRADLLRTRSVRRRVEAPHRPSARSVLRSPQNGLDPSGTHPRGRGHHQRLLARPPAGRCLRHGHRNRGPHPTARSGTGRVVPARPGPLRTRRRTPPRRRRLRHGRRHDHRLRHRDPADRTPRRPAGRAVAQNALDPGDAQCTYGTGAFLLARAATGLVSRDRVFRQRL